MTVHAIPRGTFVANEETNFYKQELKEALDIIDEEREKVRGENGMGHGVKNKIATQEGWVCTEADNWVTDFTGRCTPVMNEFDTAWDEINTLHEDEPVKVDEGDPRGLAYRSGHDPAPQIPR